MSGKRDFSFSRRDVLKLSLMSGSILLLGRRRFLPGPAYELAGDVPDTPNVLVLVFDTMSAKHLSLYGYPRETMPNLARIAENAIVYHRHYASANFTSPGTASILTGTYPWTHGAYHLHGTVKVARQTYNLFSLLGDTHHTFAYTQNLLARMLLEQFAPWIDELVETSRLARFSGTFAPALFSNDYNAAYEAEILAFRNGGFPPGSLFLSMIDKMRLKVSGTRADRAFRSQFPLGLPSFPDETSPDVLYFTLEDVTDWLQKQVVSIQHPFMGYVHVLPPHEPYRTRREFVNVFDDALQFPGKPHLAFSGDKSENELYLQRRYYDEFIAYADAEVGRLYSFLEQKGFLENTILVFTSDHGQLFERGVHGHLTPLLYDPLLHVPLLISIPGHRGRQDILTPTSCIDLLPTLAYLAGKPAPPWAEGVLLPPWNPNPNFGRAIFAVEAKTNPKYDRLKIGTLAVIQREYKLIRYMGYNDQPDSIELYNIKYDSEEREDLATSQPDVAQSLVNLLNEKLNEVE